MTSDLKLNLKELLHLINEYKNQLKTINNDEVSNKHKEHYIKLKAAFKTIQKSFNENEDNCLININLVKPLISPVYLPKCGVILQVNAKKECNWLEQEIKLDFATKINNQWTTTRTIVIPKKQISFEGNDFEGIVSFDFTFNDDEKNVTINYAGSSIAIQYAKYKALKLDTPSNATNTKENFNPLYTKLELREQIKKTFPNAQFVINENADWKSTLISKSIKEDLENTAIIGLPQNLDSLTREELEAFNTQINSRKNQLAAVNKILKKSLQRYESLEANYDGDKTAIFDVAYHKKIEESRIAIDAITERFRLLEDLLSIILDAQMKLKKAMSMPVSPFNIASKEFSKKLKTFWAIVEEITSRFDSYNDLILNHEEWENELNNTITQISVLKEESTTTWSNLYSMDRTTNKEDEKFEELQQNYNSLLTTLSNLEENKSFLSKKEGFGKSGDGFLEYKEREDRFSTEEKKQLGLTEKQKEKLKENGGKSSFSFKEPNLPLYDKKSGIELGDIDQGQVGDCYLLSAIANLTKNDSHLIQEMIEEKDGLYIVTLYQNGIPIKVEVDKKLMHLKIEQTNSSGSKNKTEEFLGAAPKNDIWVPIIEKAYVKLMANGEFTHENVKGGHADNAMKILLGNKVTIPKVIFLDQNGNLSDSPTKNELTNPLVFAKTSEKDLKQVILSAIQKGYKINVSSPSKYKGDSILTDQHIVDIGEDNYMNFKHAYSVVTANESTITLFNPHGSDEIFRERKIFDPNVKKAYNELVSLLPSKGKISPEVKAKIEAIFNKNEALKNESDKIMANLRIKIDYLGDRPVAKGFVPRVLKITSTQTISYKTLKDYFNNLAISIIKK